MNSLFDIIIPIEGSSNIKSSGKAFNIIQINRSAQLNNSIFLKDDISPLECCLELNQKYRRKIGLHSNEGHAYKLTKNNISFRIGKVKVWLFKNKIGFITINIICEEITDSSTLDLVSSLCNLYLRRNITYEQSVGKGKTEIITITLKEIIERLINIDEDIVLKKYDDEDLSKSKCLFYCYDVLSYNSIMYFLEMIRLQNNSKKRVSHCIEKDYLYKPYDYIYWAVSENGAFCYGDIANCGNQSIEFLSNNGGLRQSIFSNYEIVYLNCLSVILKYHLLCIHNNTIAIKPASNEMIEELHILLNTPVYDMTQETTINELMREYVCRNVFHLQSITQNYETNKFIDEIHRELFDIKSETIITRKNTEKALEQIDRIAKQLEYVQKFITSDLNDWLKIKKKEIIGSADSDDTITSAFVDESTHYIKSKLKDEHELLISKETEMRIIFGDVWDKLLPSSKTSLVSAGILWDSCTNISTEGFDYSGVCICATSALEAELKKIFFTDFKDFIKQTYGNPDTKDWEHTYDIWPETLLTITRKDYERKAIQGVFPKIKYNKNFTMGMLPFLFGIYESKQKALLNLRMEEYLKSVLANKYSKKPIDNFFAEGDNSCFLLSCEYVRTCFRNPAAHTDILSRDTAEKCYQVIIGSTNKGSSVPTSIGLILALYNYFD